MTSDNWTFTSSEVPESTRAPRARRDNKWERLVVQLREEAPGSRAVIANKDRTATYAYNIKSKFAKGEVPGLSPDEIGLLKVIHRKGGYSELWLELKPEAHTTHG